MVTSEGIRANPNKTMAIIDMQSPRTLKDITKENKDEYRWTESTEKAFQEMKKVIVELPLLTTPVKEETLYSLSGKLAALKRFLSRSAEKSLPFFETLKDITKENKDEYRWTEST
ncbi:hypothetical protein Tco_0207144, partial [Tanacetum coccineum]